MTHKRFNRRLHLYLGLLLTPWLIMYAVSAAVFNHGPTVRGWFDSDEPAWTMRFERPYDRVIPEGTDIRETAKAIIADAELEGSFWAHQPNPRRINIHVFSFFETTRLTYRLDKKTLKAEDKRFRLDHTLTGMHARAGFGQDSLLSDLWAVMVDIVCVGLVVWVVSGWVMWWQDRKHNAWGSISLLAGMIAFAVFVAVL